MAVKQFLAILSTIGGLFFIAGSAHAHCPLCTAATGAAVAVTRFHGVSDSVVGLWIGALAVSMVLWFNRILKRQYIPFQGEVLTVAAILATVIPFQLVGLFNIPGNTMFGIDKLLFGILLGGFLTWLVPIISKHIKIVNSGRVLFPRQTLILSIVVLIAASAVFLWI